MLRSGRASICVDEERLPYSFISIEGEVSIDELPPAELLPWATRIGERYMGADLADAYGMLLRDAPDRPKSRNREPTREELNRRWKLERR